MAFFTPVDNFLVYKQEIFFLSTLYLADFQLNEGFFLVINTFNSPYNYY